MIYRKIREEEAKDFADLSSTAFFANAENAYKDIEKGEFLIDTIRVLDEKNGRISTGLRLFDIEMFLDTGYVRTGGIGDVSTYPESRRQGNINKLFDFALREMYEDNYVLSYLYPFSHPFYRKYGYELCRNKHIVTFPADSILMKNDKGYVKQHVYGTESDLSEDIKSVYSKYADGMNLMVRRSGWFWDRILKENPYTSKSRLYVFYLENGAPCAYFQYDYEKIDFVTFNAKIFDMAFVSREAFDMMLNFIYKLAPSVKKVSLSCPPMLDVFGIIDEPWKVEMKSEAGGMMRIVNVKRALEMMNVPNIKTMLNIRINDKNIKENNDTFAVDIDMGTISVKANNSIVSPDMECSIHALNQLVSGYAGIKDVLHRDDVKVTSRFDELNKLFIKRPIHLQDHF